MQRCTVVGQWNRNGHSCAFLKSRLPINYRWKSKSTFVMRPTRKSNTIIAKQIKNKSIHKNKHTTQSKYFWKQHRLHNRTSCGDVLWTGSDVGTSCDAGAIALWLLRDVMCCSRCAAGCAVWCRLLWRVLVISVACMAAVGVKFLSGGLTSPGDLQESETFDRSLLQHQKHKWTKYFASL